MADETSGSPTVPTPPSTDPVAYIFRNPICASADNSMINCEIDHPQFGWIPFTAHKDDAVAAGAATYDAILAAGNIAPYVAPSADDLRALMPTLSPRQIRLGLLSVNITEDQVNSALADDPQGLIEWQYATEFERLHPLVVSLGQHFDLPPDQIDSLWGWAAGI